LRRLEEEWGQQQDPLGDLDGED